MSNYHKKLNYVMDRFMRAETPWVFKPPPTNGAEKLLRGVDSRSVSC